MSLTITIPDSVIASAQVTEDELKQEIAIALFQQDRLTLAEASSLANMTRLNFRRLLGSRHIPIYEVSDFEKDIENLQAVDSRNEIPEPSAEFPADLVGSFNSKTQSLQGKSVGEDDAFGQYVVEKMKKQGIHLP